MPLRQSAPRRRRPRRPREGRRGPRGGPRVRAGAGAPARNCVRRGAPASALLLTAVCICRWFLVAALALAAAAPAAGAVYGSAWPAARSGGCAVVDIFPGAVRHRVVMADVRAVGRCLFPTSSEAGMGLQRAGMRLSGEGSPGIRAALFKGRGGDTPIYRNQINADFWSGTALGFHDFPPTDAVPKGMLMRAGGVFQLCRLGGAYRRTMPRKASSSSSRKSCMASILSRQFAEKWNDAASAPMLDLPEPLPGRPPRPLLERLLERRPEEGDEEDRGEAIVFPDPAVS
jgi:hypothetical protein